MKLRNVFCTGMLVFILASSAAGSETDGFRNFIWGSELTQFLDSEQKKVEGQMGAVPGVEAYKLKSEDLNYGGIKADGIVYSFNKGRLSAVSIDFRGFDSFEKLMAYCKKIYGPLTGSVTMKQEHYASFDSPKTGVMLLYQLSMANSSYGRLYLYSKEYLP